MVFWQEAQSPMLQGLLYQSSLMTDSSIKVSKGAKIRNRYNQVPHMTQDTNGYKSDPQSFYKLSQCCLLRHNFKDIMITS